MLRRVEDSAGRGSCVLVRGMVASCQWVRTALWCDRQRCWQSRHLWYSEYQAEATTVHWHCMHRVLRTYVPNTGA